MWHGTMFRLFVPDQPWQLLHFVDERGDFRHWYVDFESAKSPDRHGGWTTTDLEPDRIIGPDFTTAWKDRDEFVAALEQGFPDTGAVDEMLPLADAIRRDP